MDDRLILDGWGYLYEVASGRLLSEGTRFTDPLAEGHELLERSEQHDSATERWDSAARSIVPILDVDRANDLDAQAEQLTTEAARLRGG